MRLESLRGNPLYALSTGALPGAEHGRRRTWCWCQCTVRPLPPRFALCGFWQRPEALTARRACVGGGAPLYDLVDSFPAAARAGQYA